MNKQLLCMIYLLLSAGIAFTQNKPKAPVKQPVTELKKLLSGSGLPFEMVNDSLAVIPYEGEHIASFQVLVQKISDMYIILTNLSETLPGKIDETKYKYLLHQNDNFDAVKIGISATDNIVYLRADLYKSGTNTALLTRIIKQVANATNIIGGDLK